MWKTTDGWLARARGLKYTVNVKSKYMVSKSARWCELVRLVPMGDQQIIIQGFL